MAEEQKKTNLDYVNEIWNIADYVRDVISRADYNKVVLPFALLRRLECALEPTRTAVCEAVKEHEKDWGRESDNYCQYSGKAFYYVFQSLYFNKVYYELAQGVAEVGRKRLQAPAFKELKLPCPSSDEPAKIAAYIKDKCMDIDALIEKKQTAINKREEYKKSLIYYTVTGKIDCRNEVM